MKSSRNYQQQCEYISRRRKRGREAFRPCLSPRLRVGPWIDRLAVRTQRPFAKTVMTMRGALGLLAIVLCAVLHGRHCLGASVRRRGDISSTDNNLLVSNNDNSDSKALPPKPQYVCPAMDMLHIRKVGPSPIMLRDGTTFNPDERDKNIVKDEIVHTGNLFTHYTGQRAQTFPSCIRSRKKHAKSHFRKHV